MNWDYADPFVIDLRVLAEDIDGLGHANNAVYVSWLERCAWRHSQRLGLDLAEYRRLDRAMRCCATRSTTWPRPTRATNCNWRPGSSSPTSACG
ncbi:thioesterase [Pseudomonas aeruginosa]|nr:thioesterase [Pseudomonas aeruginosa]